MAYTIADVTDHLFVAVLNEAIWLTDATYENIADRLDDFSVTEEDIKNWLKHEELPNKQRQMDIMNHLEPDANLEEFLDEGD